MGTGTSGGGRIDRFYSRKRIVESVTSYWVLEIGSDHPAWFIEINFTQFAVVA
jgi:hypothetical protein